MSEDDERCKFGDNVVGILLQTCESIFGEHERRPGQSAYGLTSVLCRPTVHQSTGRNHLGMNRSSFDDARSYLVLLFFEPDAKL
jgi:hypothetical protein